MLLFLATLSTAQTQPAQPACRPPARRASRRPSSRSSVSAWTISSRSKSAEEGLGPAFNGTSCAACHNVPGIGGGGVMAELRAGRRNADGEFETFDSTGETLFHLFSVPSHGCQPMLPGRCHRVRATRADPALRRRARRSHSRRDAAQPRGPERSQRRRRQRARRARRRYRHRRAPGRPFRLEVAARHAVDVRRRRLPQRNGDHQRRVPAGGGVRHHTGADAGVRSDPRSRGRPRSANAAARHRQLRHVHAVPGADRAGGCERSGPRGRTGLRRHRLHDLPHPHPRDRAELESAVPPQDGSRCFRICCCTTSAPATASSRARPRPTRSARRPSGACVSGVRSCTTAPRRRPRKPSSGTPERRCWLDAASSASATPIGPRSWRSCDRCERRSQFASPDSSLVHGSRSQLLQTSRTADQTAIVRPPSEYVATDVGVSQTRTAWMSTPSARPWS